MNINRETKPQLHSTRVLLKLLFRVQIAGLYRLVEQFGGENLAVRLDQIVRDTAQLRNWSIRIEHGLIHNMRTDLSWRDYSAVMGEALSFAISVAGYRLVEEKVKGLTSALEDKTGKSYFEIAFRLGLHRMQRKIA